MVRHAPALAFWAGISLWIFPDEPIGWKGRQQAALRVLLEVEMIGRRRRGSIPYEFALNVTLFVGVATVGLVSPSAFHDTLLGAPQQAPVDAVPPVVVAAPIVAGNAPAFLQTPGEVVVPWLATDAPPVLTPVDPRCSAPGADPWVLAACAPVEDSLPKDVKPWAATPWGVE